MISGPFHPVATVSEGISIYDYWRMYFACEVLTAMIVKNPNNRFVPKDFTHMVDTSFDVSEQMLRRAGVEK